jgi:eukaryotic-like serine/threonine-protein kinase
MSSFKTIKDFFIHLGFILGVFILILYVFFYVYLPTTTHHGESIEVPNLIGKKISEIEQITKENELLFVVFDSTYTPNIPPLEVLNQFPSASEVVKKQRTIYVSISSFQPPMIKMPNLVSNSLKSAELTIKSHGLVLGQVSYAPNVNEGAVLKQMIGYETIREGSLVKKGSVINLLVASGLSDVQVAIPSLVGLSLDEAKTLLKIQGLELGSVVMEESSEEKGKIIRQKPSYDSSDTTRTLQIGDIIDLWVSGIEETKLP